MNWLCMVLSRFLTVSGNRISSGVPCAMCRRHSVPNVGDRATTQFYKDGWLRANHDITQTQTKHAWTYVICIYVCIWIGAIMFVCLSVCVPACCLLAGCLFVSPPACLAGCLFVCCQSVWVHTCMNAMLCNVLQCNEKCMEMSCCVLIYVCIYISWTSHAYSKHALRITEANSWGHRTGCALRRIADGSLFLWQKWYPALCRQQWCEYSII